MYYYLNKHKPHACTFDEWFKKNPLSKNRIASTKLFGYHVSTIFLGINHNYGYSSDKPLLFETMIFNKDLDDEYQTQCSTWNQSVKMHIKAILFVIKHRFKKT